MEIKILTKAEQDIYDSEILDILNECDTEFVPPLSARSSTTQADLTGKTKLLAMAAANFGEKMKDGVKSE